MEKMGQEKGELSISQIALTWHLSNPIITSPIIGPRNLEQLEDNLGAVGLRLSKEEMAVLNQATE
jgi:aryl-alcohol dehydrogenase-like predicted oxidoreductase